MATIAGEATRPPMRPRVTCFVRVAFVPLVAADEHPAAPTTVRGLRWRPPPRARWLACGRCWLSKTLDPWGAPVYSYKYAIRSNEYPIRSLGST